MQSQTKLQKSSHFFVGWVSYNNFIFLIKYKMGIHNKVANMLSRPIINASTILRHTSLANESFVEQYARDDYFKDVYEYTINQNQND